MQILCLWNFLQEGATIYWMFTHHEVEWSMIRTFITIVSENKWSPCHQFLKATCHCNRTSAKPGKSSYWPRSVWTNNIQNSISIVLRCMWTLLKIESHLAFHIIQRVNDIIVCQITKILILNRRIEEGNEVRERCP